MNPVQILLAEGNNGDVFLIRTATSGRRPFLFDFSQM